jgi:2'-5' RNA ligase
VGISLWLVPEAGQAERLWALTSALAERFDTPRFAPHLTLLAGLDAVQDVVLARTRELAAGFRPMDLRLGPVEGREELYRCLFFLAEPAAALAAAHAAAAAAFARAADPAFLPHVSLVYGRLPPERKHAIAQELALWSGTPLTARRLEAWLTEGPPGDWRVLGSFALA